MVYGDRAKEIVWIGFGYGYEIDWVALYIHLYTNAWFLLGGQFTV